MVVRFGSLSAFPVDSAARSCYLTPATPATPVTPASYIKGTAVNFNVEKLACRIHENGAQNLLVTGEEFSVFLPQKSDNPSYATVVPVV